MNEQYRKYIEERSQPVPYVGCWLWLLSIGTHGYGQACVDSRHTTAQRISYEGFVGPIPSGMLIQHSCDNKWCVNPDHLSLGTDKSNAIDKQRKGRAVKKLSLEDRETIRTDYEAGEWTQRELAKRFSVDQKAIWQVIHRYGMHGRNTV